MTNEIEDGTYTAAELSAMGGAAWIAEAIEAIRDYEVEMGLEGAAEIKDGKVVAICEAK